MFTIDARLGIGYGDAISLLCYADNCTKRYNKNVTLNFHFPHNKNYKVSVNDPETVIERVNILADELNIQNNLNFVYESNPSYRFINHLEEFNPLHGYSKFLTKPKINNKVVLWTSKYNTYSVGKQKDPCLDFWDIIKKYLIKNNFSVVEITYRTPLKIALHHIQTCEFGIGYDGMVHQLFKPAQKPCIILCERHSLNRLLIPHGKLISSAEEFLNVSLNDHIQYSENLLTTIIKKYNNYLSESFDYENHRLFNTPVN